MLYELEPPTNESYTCPEHMTISQMFNNQFYLRINEIIALVSRKMVEIRHAASYRDTYKTTSCISGLSTNYPYGVSCNERTARLSCLVVHLKA